jgi:hypothetical protein
MQFSSCRLENWMRRTVSLLVFLLVLGCSAKPPQESELIREFYAHHSAFEHLRDMLQADRKVLSVSKSGIETIESAGLTKVPAQGDSFSNRYMEYVSFLKEAGALGVFRRDGVGSQDVSIGVWASGWGSDTRHVEFAWVEHKPDKQVDSLDRYYRTSTPHSPVFRHIEGNWYLWADW